MHIDTLNAILNRLNHAREKHPHWRGRGQRYAESALMGEVAEYLVAVRKETGERQKDEILDVIATAIRIYEEEYND